MLAAVPAPDWPQLAAAHRREPFGLSQQRALIARPDCPDALTAALLTPWQPRLANRLAARRRPLPAAVWRPGLVRLGELRPSLLRHVLAHPDGPAERTAADLLDGTPRVDLLVRIVDGYDHNHGAPAGTFWAAVGSALREELGADPDAWRAAAALVPHHPGRLAPLVRRIRHGATGAALPDGPDLRVLAQAPPAVLAAVLAGLDDARLDRLADRSWGRLRAREALRAGVLARIRAAGAPPRALYTRWAYGPSHRHLATTVWLFGADPDFDRRTREAACTDPALRSALAARHAVDATPGTAPATALRGCADAITAEAVLTEFVGEPARPAPWAELLTAHHAAPLPEPVLCALAARAGFPPELAEALPPARQRWLARHSPAAARAVLARPDAWSDPWLLEQILSGRVLTATETVALLRPAARALRHGRWLRPGDRGAAAWQDACRTAVTTAAAGAPPGFWPAVAALLPAFDGPLAELLAAARRPAP
ncbi:hypothetical protein [Kitasatospora sp. NPDC059571]|uniref:hypothetical protein n=1 Tax=Kitasatospora sp. NPDC059571 TaxID=3346871 RepID=UPI0036AE2CF6